MTVAIVLGRHAKYQRDKAHLGLKKKWGPEGWGAPKGGGGPEGWGAQIRGIFLWRTFFDLFLVVDFWWCVEVAGPSNVHVWSSRVSHDSPPRLRKHDQNSTRRHPERHEKERKCGVEREKNAKCWAPHPSWPRTSLFFLMLIFFNGQKIETPILAKVGHPNFGQSRSNVFGQSRFGQKSVGSLHQGWGRRGGVQHLPPVFRPSDPRTGEGKGLKTCKRRRTLSSTISSTARHCSP